MNKLWQLVKINLLGFYGINKVRYSKDIEEKKKNKRQLYIALVGFLCIVYLSFYYGALLIDPFKLMNAEYLLLALGVVATSSFTLLNMFYKTNGFLFQFKDYDVISSMPIKNSTIVISRIILIYIMSMINTVLFMVPFGAIYIIAVSPSMYFYIAFIISILFVPLIPLIIGTFIGSIITIISSKFRKNNIISILFTIIFLGIIMYFSSTTTSGEQIYNLVDSFMKMLSKPYPFIQMYINGVVNGEVLEFIKFILISLALFILFTFVVARYFNKINTFLTSKKTNSKFKEKKLKSLSIKRALLKREFKRYFASSIYVLNTGIGLILLIVCSILLVFFGSDKVEALLSIENFSNMINSYAPLVLSVFISLSCTTSCSISLEGKNFWLLKTLPIKERDILMSKILLNILLTLIPIFIGGTIINIYLKSSILIIILTYIMPILYAVLISEMGIILNLYSHSFDWKNEVMVVKQSLPSMIGIFLGLGLSVLPIILIDKINMNTSIILCIFAFVLVLIDLLLYEFINKKGVKIFKKITNN